MRSYISLSSDFSSEPCARNLRLETPYQIFGHFYSDPCARDYRLQTPSKVFLVESSITLLKSKEAGTTAAEQKCMRWLCNPPPLGFQAGEE